MTDNPLTGTVRLKRRNAGALPKGEPKIKEATMKKRFLALLLAVCIGVSVLVLPASAAGSNTAVQTAVTLGAFSTEEAAGLSTPLTRWWPFLPTTITPIRRAASVPCIPM